MVINEVSYHLYTELWVIASENMMISHCTYLKDLRFLGTLYTVIPIYNSFIGKSFLKQTMKKMNNVLHLSRLYLTLHRKHAMRTAG